MGNIAYDIYASKLKVCVNGVWREVSIGAGQSKIKGSCTEGSTLLTPSDSQYHADLSELVFVLQHVACLRAEYFVYFDTRKVSHSVFHVLQRRGSWTTSCSTSRSTRVRSPWTWRSSRFQTRVGLRSLPTQPLELDAPVCPPSLSGSTTASNSTKGWRQMQHSRGSSSR